MKTTAIILFLSLVLSNHTPSSKTFSIMHPEYNQNKSNNTGLTLDGIVYISKTKWVIWLNQKRITPTSIPNWLKIRNVTPVNIECEYKAHNTWYLVNLDVFDTFVPTRKDVDIKD